MTGEFCSLLYALLFVPLVVWGVLNLMDSWRTSRNRHAFLSLSPESCRRLRELIDGRGQLQPACAILVPEDEPVAGPAESRFGGGFLKGTAPDSGEAEALFLIQVNTEDLLPAPWSQRVLQVWRQGQNTFVGRSCDPASRIEQPESGGSVEAVTEPGGAQEQTTPVLPEWRLQTVRVPRTVNESGSGSGLLPYDPALLLRTVPGLNEELSAVSSRPSEVLGFVIAPKHAGTYGFELSDIVQVGGQPEWLLEPPETPRCSECPRSARFLFQFGDLSSNSALGASGVCYVFGCDDHPETLLPVVQSC